MYLLLLLGSSNFIFDVLQVQSALVVHIMQRQSGESLTICSSESASVRASAKEYSSNASLFEAPISPRVRSAKKGDISLTCARLAASGCVQTG
jgi:hypothetical protein